MKRFTATEDEGPRTSRHTSRQSSRRSSRKSLAALSGIFASNKAAFNQKTQSEDEELPTPRLSIAAIARVKLKFAKQVCNWKAEATHLAGNTPFEYGRCTPGGAQEDQRLEEYRISGHYAVLWCRATAEQRVGVIEAFGSNTTVNKVEMYNAIITDDEGQAMRIGMAYLWISLIYVLPADSLRTNGKQGTAILLALLLPTHVSPSFGRRGVACCSATRRLPR